MKPLSKLIVEAGLVDRHLVAAMERWGTLDHGTSEFIGVKAITKDTLESFAEDIAYLVEDATAKFRETILDPEYLTEMAMLVDGGVVTPAFKGNIDVSNGCVYVDPTAQVIRGSLIADVIDTSVIYYVTDIDRVWQDDKVIAKRLSICNVDNISRKEPDAL